MTNIKDAILKTKSQGYSEDMIEAKVCQDIILTLFAKSKFCHNITIKGGVVMRSISNNQRRSTIDIDIDFLKYPLTDNSVYELIEELNFVSDITVAIKGPIEELKHQDYQGKRAFLEIKDIYGTIISTKLDIGVNKYHSISQINHCFDVSISNEIVMLLINSKEQIFTEKIKSLLRFGIFTTRFKDIYDLYYLSYQVDKKELICCFDILIFHDLSVREQNIDDIFKRVDQTFKSIRFLNGLSSSKKNWIGISDNIVLKQILDFILGLNHFNKPIE